MLPVLSFCIIPCLFTTSLSPVTSTTGMSFLTFGATGPGMAMENNVPNPLLTSPLTEVDTSRLLTSLTRGNWNILPNVPADDVLSIATVFDRVVAEVRYLVATVSLSAAPLKVFGTDFL